MGEQKIPVMVKMRPELHDAFMRELTLWQPAIQKHGPMGEMLISVGISIFNAGIVTRTPQAVQELLRKTLVTPLTVNSTVYAYKGFARSEQEANDFVAMVMDEIVAAEPRRADVAGLDQSCPSTKKTIASAAMPTAAIPDVGAAPRRAGYVQERPLSLQMEEDSVAIPTAPTTQPGPIAAERKTSKRRTA